MNLKTRITKLEGQLIEQGDDFELYGQAMSWLIKSGWDNMPLEYRKILKQMTLVSWVKHAHSLS